MLATPRRKLGRRELALVVGFGLLMGVPRRAAAASLSNKDLQVLARALALMKPAPAGMLTLAIAYHANDEASHQDAEAIAALVAGGLRAGAALYQPKLLDTASLGRGGFAAILAAAGAAGEQVMLASRTSQVLSATADFAAVQAGQCVMAIRAVPRVEILLNHLAAAAAGVEFVPAFLMMIREI